MGRSAKFHKRQDKKKTSSAGSGSAPAQRPAAVPHHLKSKPKATAAAAAPTPKEQKKRAGLKDKAKGSTRRREGDRDGPVLGGADYVELMLGGRRKAAAEAAKLPQDPDPDSM
ncbi:hypothetical protein V8D89_007626 [Ganoderma adspersum]